MLDHDSDRHIEFICISCFLFSPLLLGEIPEKYGKNSLNIFLLDPWDLLVELEEIRPKKLVLVVLQ